MSPELEKRLIKRFPRLYIEYHKSPQETCMCWGFDHGDGWFDLIWMLSLAIEDELKQHADPNFAVVQVKEKFGGLRYYINDPNERIHKLVALAERASESTCEVCGGWGKTRRRGCWLKTLCFAPAHRPVPQTEAFRLLERKRRTPRNSGANAKKSSRDDLIGRIPSLFLGYASCCFSNKEEVLKRPEHRLAHGLTPEAVDEFLAELAALIEPVELQFQWTPGARPQSLEAAINASEDGSLMQQRRLRRVVLARV